MQFVSRAEIVAKIKATKSKIFTVTFLKRDSTEIRVMNCRLGVKKFVKGTGRTVDPKHKLITVYDLQVAKTDPERAYRSISEEGILTATIDGEEYRVQ